MLFVVVRLWKFYFCVNWCKELLIIGRYIYCRENKWILLVGLKNLCFLRYMKMFLYLFIIIWLIFFYNFLIFWLCIDFFVIILFWFKLCFCSMYFVILIFLRFWLDCLCVGEEYCVIVCWKCLSIVEVLLFVDVCR